MTPNTVLLKLLTISSISGVMGDRGDYERCFGSKKVSAVDSLEAKKKINHPLSSQTNLSDLVIDRSSSPWPET